MQKICYNFPTSLDSFQILSLYYPVNHQNNAAIDINRTTWSIR